jgi:hypothetical protein
MAFRMVSKLAKSNQSRSDSLTLTALNKRLQQVLAIHGGTHQAQRELLCTRLDDLQLCRARLGPSPGAGNGVFATRGICEGELVTCFPGDWTISASGKHVDVKFGPHVPDDQRDLVHATSVEAKEYAFTHDSEGDTSLTLVGSPSLTSDPAYLGHLLNDCGVLTNVDGICEYALAAATRMNAAHVSLGECHVVTVATKAISAGDEVLVTCEDDATPPEPLD